MQELCARLLKQQHPGTRKIKNNVLQIVGFSLLEKFDYEYFNLFLNFFEVQIQSRVPIFAGRK